ncbi:PREDICTED: LOW QUALITY PROTEIN: killer cell lectin-like receptor subfamily F, member 1 [Lipotes vexillifer]|uniref:LOW QUALITY PROTEIN: killer cell lectin-like receptor subfamily F, member 1 n=1 Tax=Lipotes vexillifer TaxID=118797 RepID=A0A340YJW0_LIPVE|nr:PREDICTED: LOW QUALITY PROTEIN: killer cell lectin-like receptor subfamily F, member 1 [Lipotes vexillifer]
MKSAEADFLTTLPSAFFFSVPAKGLSLADLSSTCELVHSSGSNFLHLQVDIQFFQRHLEQSNYVWIWLNFTSLKRKWTWVDGSPLDSKIFFIKGPTKENSCAAIKENRIYSETCNSVFKWICQY